MSSSSAGRSSGGSRLAPLALGALLLATGCGLDPSRIMPGASTCQGVEASMCQRLVTEAGFDPTRRASSVEVRCATGRCDQRDGEVSIRIEWTDGSSSVRMIGWSAQHAPPGSPVVPTCEGLEVDLCGRHAAATWQVGEEATIAAIHIRCEGVCGPEQGQGTSRVTFRDHRVRAEDFGYSLAEPPRP